MQAATLLRQMRNLKLTLQYDGTEYVGWQRQKNGVSIQGLLEEALERIEGASVTVKRRPLDEVRAFNRWVSR